MGPYSPKPFTTNHEVQIRNPNPQTTTRTATTPTTATTTTARSLSPQHGPPAVAHKRLNKIRAPANAPQPVSLPEAFDGNQELYGEVRPKPPTLRRRTRKTPKILHPAGGESSLDGIRVAREHLQEHSPPFVLRVPKIGKKNGILTHFSEDFSPFEIQNAVNYNIFAF